MNKICITGIAVLSVLSLAIGGCIFTGTVVVTATLAPDADGNPVTVSNSDYVDGELEVNLNDDPTFRDYRDDIRNIENIGFYLSATNILQTDITVQLFLEPDTAMNWPSAQVVADTSASPRTQVDLILTGVTIPGGQTVTVNWNQSMAYVTNLEFFRRTLETGVFSLYPAAFNPVDGSRDTFRISIDSLVVIVTLSGAK